MNSELIRKSDSYVSSEPLFCLLMSYPLSNVFAVYTQQNQTAALISSNARAVNALIADVPVTVGQTVVMALMNKIVVSNASPGELCSSQLVRLIYTYIHSLLVAEVSFGVLCWFSEFWFDSAECLRFALEALSHFPVCVCTLCFLSVLLQ